MSISELKIETEFCGEKLEVEVGKLCLQSNGSCLIRCNDTIVLSNVVMSKAPREGIDFFPLNVDYEEKMYAIGKIPGGYIKREGKASEKAILTARLIDRPLRPLFPKGFLNDVAVTCTVLSLDHDYQAEILSMLSSSIALSISDIPFLGPIGAISIGYLDKKFIPYPNTAIRAKSNLQLIVAGTRDAIMMVEAGANCLDEGIVLDGIIFAHDIIKKQVDFIDKIVSKIGKKKSTVPLKTIADDINKKVRDFASSYVDFALETFDREERQKRQDEIQQKIMDQFCDQDASIINEIIYNLTKEKVREKILSKNMRPDGRGFQDIRNIWCEVGLLPRTHGSAIFTRGLSQALTTATLGSISDMQKLDTLEEENFKRYMHHYNFPPYSTGESKPIKAPSRREIGHGALAERALEPVLPNEDEFPYAIRTVSEILSSNGSTSQASVCGSSLALMDAGVPIKSHVAGIAMGLIKDQKTDKFVVLSDIQGIEDFFGDMDFKVAGTKDGITAIQMDIKTNGITKEILKIALEQARVGRMKIINEMQKVIDKPRTSLSKFAPKILCFKIDPKKIGDVIGKNGKIINQIIAKYNVKIDIDENGKTTLISDDMESCHKAKDVILNITKNIKVGDVLQARIVKKVDFGVFVSFAPGREGLLHRKDLQDGIIKIMEKNIGDKIMVQVIKCDDKGRIALKLKDC